jgi:RNA polymerase sigma-70 factor (ECF subfamily)
MTAALGIPFQAASSVDAAHAGENTPPAPVATSTYDDGLPAFLSVRPRLFGIAYRMLGSAAEAEDVVQDTWVRWQTTDRGVVRDATAFLVTTATRLAINVMQSARSRRETYVGPWLPEPVDTSADPRLGAERGEALAFGVLLLLETLTPAERAAYVLREAFDYPYRDIANVLRLEEANTRQLVTRARQHVASGRKTTANSSEQRRLLEAFVAAARNGDAAGLEGLFSSDVVSTSDGGGLVRAARLPVVGRERVAKFIATVAAPFWSEMTLSWVDANGQPCVGMSRDGNVVALLSIDASTEGIDQIRWMMRPSKLAAVTQAAIPPHAQIR